MIETLIIVLLILWMAGLITLPHLTGGVIHLLLIGAVVLLVVRIFQEKK